MTLTNIKKHIPVFLLIAVVLVYWSSSTIINPIAAILLLLLSTQLILKNSKLQLALGVLFLLLGFIMFLAILSDLAKHNTSVEISTISLISRIVFCSAIIAPSLFMLGKHSSLKK